MSVSATQSEVPRTGLAWFTLAASTCALLLLLFWALTNQDKLFQQPSLDTGAADRDVKSPTELAEGVDPGESSIEIIDRTSTATTAKNTANADNAESQIAGLASEQSSNVAQKAAQQELSENTLTNEALQLVSPEATANSEQVATSEKSNIEPSLVQQVQSQDVGVEPVETQSVQQDALEKTSNEKLVVEQAEPEAGVVRQAQNAAAQNLEAETAAAELAELERIAAEKAEAERQAAEKAESERLAAEKSEADRVAAEQAETEKLAAEQAEAERLAAEKAEAEKLAAEKAEAERLAAEKAEAEKLAAEQAEAERLAAEKAEAQRLAAEKAEAERVAAEKAEAEKLAAEKAEAERLAAQKAEADRLTAEQQALEARLAAEKRQAEQLAASPNRPIPLVDSIAVPAASVTENETAFEKFRREELAGIPRLSAQVRFKSNDIETIESSKQSMDRLFELLFLYSETTVTVQVASNEYEIDSNNQLISRERALTLVNYLIDRGLDEGRFRIRALGKQRLPFDSHRVTVIATVIDK